jgi:hypothetical protein
MTLVTDWATPSRALASASFPGGTIAGQPAELGGFLASTGLDLTPFVTAKAEGPVVHLRPRTGLAGYAAFVQPCEALAVGFEHVRFCRCPVVVDW